MLSTKSTAAALLSLLMFDGVQGQARVNHTHKLSGFAPCDALITANLSHAVHLPSSPFYSSLVLGSWTLDTQRSPWCFVVPSTPAEVSQTLTALRSAGDGAGDWHIAIRSGGHGSDNANSIEQGVIIDLSHLNATTYDAATNVASVGTGARWGDVYAELEKSGVSVTGGREGAVGVGGLLLGGGVSWHTARTGFACDNVVNYEVVLASGLIINANATDHSDLFRALKGGGSNFGIVTRFDLAAFPATNLTIERRTIGVEHADEVVDAVVAFTDLDQSFKDNAMLAIMTYDPRAEGITITVTEVNTMNNANSTAFDAFSQFPTLAPATKDSLTLSQSANSSQLPGNTRNVGAGPLTIANDPRVMRYCIEQHTSLVEDLKTTLGLQNFSIILDFQPLPSYFADIGVRKGGNMLGLERNLRNKVLVVPGVTLQTSNSESQYPGVYQQVAAMAQRIQAFAKSVGSSEDFTYLNYADTTQDPLGSYGAANVKHIRKVANKYDPYSFFQRRVPGGFKIDRVV
ncbi:FAD-dependent monooxygenase yanF [Colletotrichum spaethianum]|uniref:FAD-dependent monooxygenase yanF n=1 Tax=Colletotrichum spaethianum TaxID=700344 RepID=A0AA37PH40_9PEZI|nr:FAD-dependent monooxygenase yanF [Colletotrichum spaethianum]GKT52211.1 FAD-dependent monooxygenase yanF [Colletotrichum spaethianum]